MAIGITIAYIKMPLSSVCLSNFSENQNLGYCRQLVFQTRVLLKLLRVFITGGAVWNE